MSDVSACHVCFWIDTPPKINVEPENEGWEEDVSFPGGPVFSGSSRSSSRGVKQIAVENPCSSGWYIYFPRNAKFVDWGLQVNVIP